MRSTRPSSRTRRKLAFTGSSSAVAIVAAGRLLVVSRASWARTSEPSGASPGMTRTSPGRRRGGERHAHGVAGAALAWRGSTNSIGKSDADSAPEGFRDPLGAVADDDHDPARRQRDPRKRPAPSAGRRGVQDLGRRRLHARACFAGGEHDRPPGVGSSRSSRPSHLAPSSVAPCPVRCSGGGEFRTSHLGQLQRTPCCRYTTPDRPEPTSPCPCDVPGALIAVPNVTCVALAGASPPSWAPCSACKRHAQEEHKKLLKKERAGSAASKAARPLVTE